MDLFTEYLEGRAQINAQLSAGDLSNEAATAQMQSLIDGLLARQSDLPEPPEDVVLAASIGSYIDCAIEGTTLSGAEAELNQGLNLGQNEIPFDLIFADAPTTVPTGIVRNEELPPAGARFASPVADFLGVSQVMVDPGQRDYIYLSAQATPSFQAEGGAVEAVAGAFAVVSANPTRLSMRYLFPNEAVSRMGPSLEATLRTNLQDGINAKLDQNVIRGDGSANQLNGLNNRVSSQLFAANGETQSTWMNYYDAIADGMDGIFVDSLSTVRMIISPDCWKHARAQFGPSGEPIKSALEGMMMEGAQVRMSDHSVADLPATNTTGKTASATWVGAPGGFDLLIWNSLRILRNDQTYDSSDQVLLTGHIHCNLINKPQLIGGSVVNFPGLAEPEFVISDKS